MARAAFRESERNDLEGIMRKAFRMARKRQGLESSEQGHK